jgi:hypothetical protein
MQRSKVLIVWSQLEAYRVTIVVPQQLQPDTLVLTATSFYELTGFAPTLMKQTNRDALDY